METRTWRNCCASKVDTNEPKKANQRINDYTNMKTHSFFSRVCEFQIHRRTAILLVAMAWSSLAFCGEIHDAAKSGDLEKVKALLKDNPDLVFSKDDRGNSPLHWAAFSGQEEVAELLLTNKAAVDAKDNKGNTPLHNAAGNGHKDVVELLLVHKADVNAKANNGATPLHNAAAWGRKDVAELLLAHKAEVNAKGGGDLTPLHNAA